MRKFKRKLLEFITQRVLFCAFLPVFVSICCVGCDSDPLDPTQIGRFRPVPVVNVILDSLGVIDEPQETYSEAEDPRPEDIIPYEQDYVIGTGDVVRISIYELQAEGRPYINDYQVTETGRISIPDVGIIRAAGLTERKLEEEIADNLSPGILLDPSVTANVMESASRTVSIAGQGIGRSARFQIPRYSFRLTDAIASVGGVRQFNASNIYISREVSEEEALFAQRQEFGELDNIQQENDSQPAEQSELDNTLQVITPYARGAINSNEIIISSAEMITEDELQELAEPEDLEEDIDEELDLGDLDAPNLRPATPGRIEWIFEDGKWVPVRVGPVEEVSPSKQRGQEGLIRKVPPLEEQAPRDYGWEQLGSVGLQRRLIKIPVDKLYSGDPRYNIIIRPGDSITVPVDIIGEFFVEGNVNRVGAIELTGRPINLKQAIALAGGLGPLAYPKKVEVIRRIGGDREIIVMVDLDKIAKGLQPDFYIKPLDMINVGTHGTSRWLAVLRNSFRASYGFGFVYDRNFAQRNFNNKPFDDTSWLTDLF